MIADKEHSLKRARIFEARIKNATAKARHAFAIAPINYFWTLRVANQGSIKNAHSLLDGSRFVKVRKPRRIKDFEKTYEIEKLGEMAKKDEKVLERLRDQKVDTKYVEQRKRALAKEREHKIEKDIEKLEYDPTGGGIYGLLYMDEQKTLVLQCPKRPSLEQIRKIRKYLSWYRRVAPWTAVRSVPLAHGDEGDPVVGSTSWVDHATEFLEKPESEFASVDIEDTGETSIIDEWPEGSEEFPQPDATDLLSDNEDGGASAERSTRQPTANDDEIARDLLIHAKARLTRLAKEQGETIFGAPSDAGIRRGLHNCHDAHPSEFAEEMKVVIDDASLALLCRFLAVTTLATVRETFTKGLKSRLTEYCVDIEAGNSTRLDSLLRQFEGENRSIDDLIEKIDTHVQDQKTPYEKHEFLRNLFGAPKPDSATVYKDLTDKVKNVEQQMVELTEHLINAASILYDRKIGGDELGPINDLKSLVSSIPDKRPDDPLSGKAMAEAFTAIGSGIQPLLFLDSPLGPVHASRGGVDADAPAEDEKNKPFAAAVDGGHIAKLLQAMATIQVTSPKYAGSVVSHQGSK